MPICTLYFWVLFPITPFMFCCRGKACSPVPSYDSPPQRPPPRVPPEQLNTN